MGEIPRATRPDRATTEARIYRADWYETNGDPEGRGTTIRKFLQASAKMGLPRNDLLRMATERPDVAEALEINVRVFADDFSNPRLWKERLSQPKKKTSVPIQEPTELLSNVVDGEFLGGGLLGFDSVDEFGALNHVG